MLDTQQALAPEQQSRLGNPSRRCSGQSFTSCSPAFPSSLNVSHLLQKSNHGSHLPRMEVGGVKLIAELCKIALSLASSRASRVWGMAGKAKG